MSRGSAQRIADVLEAIERCQRYAAALGGDAGVVGVAEDAIECNLQIIGEAVNHLPEDITAAHPGFPGRRSGVSDVVETHLPPLADALRGHLLSK